jgi:hypothetical protein
MALQIPIAIKEHNGGNPWDTDEVRKAVGASTGGNAWFYLTAASRDYGWTSGTRDAAKIALEEPGRDIVYAPNPDAELAAKKQAFLRIEIFKKVLEYYKGSNLPGMKYLGNTLTKEFGLDPETHEEFARIFRENCQYLGIVSGAPTTTTGKQDESETATTAGPDTVTLSEGASDSSLTAFVILPFVERDTKHPTGFFAEVLRSIITPAARDFKVKTPTARAATLSSRRLSETSSKLISLSPISPNTIPTSCSNLGVRMAQDKPVVLMKAEGTGPLFDVDNMLRVFEYSPNLWATTVEKDMPDLRDFIKGAWERQSTKTYMKILQGRGKS